MRPRKPWSRSIACQGCRNAVEIHESDLHVINVNVAFDCPVCHTDNPIDGIPGDIKGKILAEAGVRATQTIRS